MRARGVQNTRRQCPNCRHRVRPRAGEPPRFCRVCGHRLATVPSKPAVPTIPKTHPVQHAPQADGRAVAALVLGLVGLFMPPLGLLAIIFGLVGRSAIDAKPKERSGRGMATAGIALGAIELLLMLLICGGAATIA